MNFLDALKSGKRFRRKGEKNWNDNKLFHDFMAEDWEVEERTVTITAEQLHQAWVKAHDIASYIGITSASRPRLYEALKKELGL